MNIYFPKLNFILFVMLLSLISVVHANEPIKQPVAKPLSFAKAYFAGGCFWGVEYFLEKQIGVKEVTSGYMGGWVDDPSYRDVSYTHSGHVEVVEVLYDKNQVDFETLARLFFNIHDPTQIGAQGPDVGDQYSSVIFFNNQFEKESSLSLISILEEKGYEVATELKPTTKFWIAEKEHQNYYAKNKGTPYCHGYVKRL